MKKYQGIKGKNDHIVHGGSWVSEHEYGYEIYNFKPFRDYFFGFVQVKDCVKKQEKGKINIGRLGAEPEDLFIDDILVV